MKICNAIITHSINLGDQNKIFDKSPIALIITHSINLGDQNGGEGMKVYSVIITHSINLGDQNLKLVVFGLCKL